MKKMSSLLIILFSVLSHSMSIDWTGGYRIEYTDIDKPTLADPSVESRKLFQLILVKVHLILICLQHRSKQDSKLYEIAIQHLHRYF